MLQRHDQRSRLDVMLCQGEYAAPQLHSACVPALLPTSIPKNVIWTIFQVRHNRRLRRSSKLVPDVARYRSPSQDCIAHNTNEHFYHCRTRFTAWRRNCLTRLIDENIYVRWGGGHQGSHQHHSHQNILMSLCLLCLIPWSHVEAGAPLE